MNEVSRRGWCGWSVASILGASCRRGPPADPTVFTGPDFSIEPMERRELVTAILRALDDKYVFPEIAARNRPELERRWSESALQEVTSARKLTEKINADLRRLFRDKHVFLRPARSMPMIFDDREPTEVELADLAMLEAPGHFGVARVEVVSGGIGVLELDHFPLVKVPGMEQAASDAMAAVADANALVVDLRRNGGGDGDTVSLFLSYLFDEPKLLNETYDRIANVKTAQWTRAEVRGKRYTKGPVFVLTSRHTFSAGEGFAYAVQTLKRGTVVGETTGGGGHHNTFVKVGKEFVLSVAFTVSKSPVTGTNWDGVGAKPDVVANADDAFDIALKMAASAARK